MDLELYIRLFHPVGSKATVKKIREIILSKFVGWEKQTLTVPQQVQARENIGIHLLSKTGQITYLTKGEHYVPFTTPFTDPYIVIPYGTTGTTALVPILDPAKFEPTRFWVKMPVAGYLIWNAYVITEL